MHDIPGYKPAFLAPNSRTSHGLAVYCKPHLDARIKRSLTTNTCQLLHVTISSDPIKHVMLVYRSPLTSARTLFTSIQHLFKLYQYQNSAVLGDFNFDPKRMPHQHSFLFDYFQQNNYKQLVHKPTTLWGTTLDLMFVPVIMKDVHVALHSTYYSDHSTVILVI